MPPYLTRKDNTYYFRQGVPAELRAIIGRREIKRSPGRDYGQAVRACKRVAERQTHIADALARLNAASARPCSWDNIRPTKPAVSPIGESGMMFE